MVAAFNVRAKRLRQPPRLKFAEVEQFLARQEPSARCDGFRSKDGLALCTAEMRHQVCDEETKNFTSSSLILARTTRNAENGRRLLTSAAQTSLGQMPQVCRQHIRNGHWQKLCVRAQSVPTLAQPTPSCDFRDRPASSCSSRLSAEQMVEAARTTGKTDLLDKFCVACAPAGRSRPCWSWARDGGQESTLNSRTVKVPSRARSRRWRRSPIRKTA